MSAVRRTVRLLAFAAAVGAVIAYFLDPALGARRRRQVAEQLRPVMDAVAERRATAADGHGDADPSGGAAPAQVPNTV
jgi:hypothetical protein